jgi:hypothetical protein
VLLIGLSSGSEEVKSLTKITPFALCSRVVQTRQQEKRGKYRLKGLILPKFSVN